MKKSVGLSLFVLALIGAGLTVTPREGGNGAWVTPSWQLHGAAPASGDTRSLVELRQERQRAPRPVVLALR